MIGVLDYGMGNIKSVCNSLDFLGKPNVVINDLEGFNEITHLIVPGVGAFATAMSNINQKGFAAKIHEFANSGKPVLGICLGMQLLATSGTEPTETEGLNLIPGKVVKIESDSVRVPHMGWNAVALKQEDDPLFKFAKKNVDYYFVHSYHFVVDNPDHILTSTEYGEEFTSIVVKDNVYGIQFHPEKSQKSGLHLLKNFTELDAKG